MSRNALILDNVISFVELADTDLVYGPASEPPEFDFICEADWLSLVAGQGEAAHIASMGWVMSE